MRRLLRGTHRTMLTGALMLYAMVGSISAMIPVSRGVTKLPRFMAARPAQACETRLRL
jgi:hypothetical protein